MLGPIGYLMRLVTSLAVSFFLVTICPGHSWAEVQEPSGLWSGPMRGETPTKLKGAVVIDLAGIEALISKQPLLVDVGLADKKPENFPQDRLWLPTHRSIPGAVWFPGGGAAALDAEKEAAFLRRLDELVQGDRTRPIVTFCRPNCWGSWNAGKRLVMKGYTGVHWFPGGIDKWQEFHDTVAVEPDKAWDASMPK